MTETEKYKKVIDLIKIKAEEILPQGSTVTLFGSRARGDYRNDSDWDIHILTPGPEKIDFHHAYDNYVYPFELLGFDLEEEINPIIHTFSGWEKCKGILLYYNIREEGKIIYDSTK